MFKKIRKEIRSLLVTNLKAELVLSHMLLPLWVLITYFVAFSRLLPPGVNHVFVSRSGKYLFYVACILGNAFVLFLAVKRQKPSFSRNDADGFFVGDFTLVLLPLTPLLQYLINNSEILSILEIIGLMAVFILVSSLFILLVPLLFLKIGSRQALMFLGVAVSFSIINMSIMSQQFGWYQEGSLKIQGAVFAGIFLFTWLFYISNRKLLYLLVLIYFVTTSASQFFVTDSKLPTGNQTETGAKTDNALVRLVDSRKPDITPNIYLLVYDSYVINETMRAYGIENQAQEQYLEALGFRIYPHTYSIGSYTIGSMSPVLNASTERYGNERNGVSGNGVVVDLLKGFDYRTYGIFSSDHVFRGVIPGYNYSFPAVTSPAKTLVKAIMMGEFRFDVGFDEVSPDQFIDKKRSVFSGSTRTPRFVYMHSSKPGHSQNSGVCLPNELELYRERLQKANREMIQDLDAIIENDPEAIIIVAGDHGPYLTKNCHVTVDSYDLSEISRLDIQDRYGVFLAVKWPTQDFEGVDEIAVLQDLFPTIFAYLFNDPRFLETKIEPVTIGDTAVSGAGVANGIIEGGIHDGEPLFVGEDE